MEPTKKQPKKWLRTALMPALTSLIRPMPTETTKSEILLGKALKGRRREAVVATRWITQQPGITSAIIGARTMDQLRDNLGGAGWTLDDEHLQKLNVVSQPRAMYPKSMEKHMKARRDSAIKTSVE